MDEKISLDFHRIHLHITGSVNAALVPYWINWSRRIYHDLIVTASVTESACRFVSIDALKSLTDGKAWIDSWGSDYPIQVHEGLEKYTDAVAIFPASINTIMQLASGFTNTPMQMAIQLTRLPVSIARAFPGDNNIIEDKLNNLISKRDNIVISKEMPAYSLSKKSWGGSTGFYYPFVLQSLQDLISDLNI
ncbi:flavoprotein [Rothia sp. HMSC065G12]|jgi:possible phosphopantothenoylcysteine synthetase/decarboxylase|uniref:flavoprotein n=1 Tax=Rothia sp. HMSC065G12 TaxID=1739308 RepID=UPI0009F41CAE|nr:flavoprotein [Rothia sp. HMSC065G12]